MTKLPIIKAHISTANITVLEGMFATLTKDGWVIPEWLINLKRAVRTGGEVLTYAVYLRALNELRHELRTPRVSATESKEYYDEWCRWKLADREWAYGNIRNQLAIAIARSIFIKRRS